MCTIYERSCSFGMCVHVRNMHNVMYNAMYVCMYGCVCVHECDVCKHMYKCIMYSISIHEYVYVQMYMYIYIYIYIHIHRI